MADRKDEPTKERDKAADNPDDFSHLIGKQVHIHRSSSAGIGGILMGIGQQWVVVQQRGHKYPTHLPAGSIAGIEREDVPDTLPM